MYRVVMAAVAVATAFGLAPAASAAPEYTFHVEAGKSAGWSGSTETNANPYYFRGTGRLATVAGNEVPPRTLGPFQEERCSTAQYEQCDDVLVELINPLTQDDRDKGRTTKVRSVAISLAESPERVPDFDLRVFRSDATGAALGYWTGNANGSTSGNFNVQTPGESLSLEVETSISEPSRWMLIRVIRFASPNASYAATVTF